MSFTPMDLIMVSKYAEFPDTLVTLELCRRQAQLEKRSVPEALRACARIRAEKAVNRRLKDTLAVMSSSLFPETSIRQIRSCIEKMQNKLAREMMGKLITCEDMDELKRLSEEEPDGG